VNSVLTEAPYALLITGIILVGLWMANYFYDQQIPQYVSRKVGHGVGGVAYLLCALLFSSPFWPVVLSAGFTLILGGARFIKPSTFRGVGGSGRVHALAEVWFPLAGTIALIVGWVWLNNPWLAVVPILFMAWGDMLTGLIRSQVYGREVKGNWGSLGMLAACLLIAYFIEPYWIGLSGAVVAVLAEKYTPLSKGFWDDNHTIITSSLVVMSLLSWAMGVV